VNFLHIALTDDHLFSAWNKVRDNAGSAGVDGVTIHQFGEKLFARLVTLRNEVEQKEYQPAALLEVFVPKKNGKLRRLCIPTVRDRILQTSVTMAIAAPVEQALEEASYAYRVGSSVQMAVAQVINLRNQGFQWVVDADIPSFFDNISHAVLLKKLTKTLSESSVIPLIELWLAATVQPDKNQPYLLDKGVPQGSPISPLLANLYLDDFDEALLGEHLRLVRFADDFLILCKDKNEAEHALELSQEVVETLKLELNLGKTRITNFEEGFRFLGVDFIRNLIRAVEPGTARWVIPKHIHTAQPNKVEPSEDESVLQGQIDMAEAGQSEPTLSNPVKNAFKRRRREIPSLDTVDSEPYTIEEDNSLEPLVRSLIVTGQGLFLHKDSDRLVVVKEKEVLDSIPLNLLDQVLLQGNQMVSTALLRFAARNSIEFYFADNLGNCQAALDTFRHNHTRLHKAQFQRDDEGDFKLMLGRAFVGGKIHNSRVLLRRYNRTRNIGEMERLQQAMGELVNKLSTTSNLDVVRGIEGQAAHLYFTALRHLIPDEWGFKARRRRPPEDPFNTLISYGYGVLFKTIMSLVHKQGLNPYLGALHALKPGHPALISDLMEEFRAPVVDTIALYAILNGALKPNDFILDPGAEFPCCLAEEPRKKYLALLQNKFHSQLLHPKVGQKMDYQRALQFQIYHYARVMLGEDRVYDPFKLR